MVLLARGKPWRSKHLPRCSLLVFKGKIFQAPVCCQNWLSNTCFCSGLHDLPSEHRNFSVLQVSRVRWHFYILAGNGGVTTMALESMRLLIESGDGSRAKEYRIDDGNVEVRTLDPEGGSVRSTGSVWWRLTPEQLRIHVERSTVVAQWLERRLGWRRLLQACVDQESSMSKVA